MKINIEFARRIGIGQYVGRNLVRQFHKRVLRRDHAFRLPTGASYVAPIWDPSATEAFVTKGDMDLGSEAALFAFAEGPGAFVDVGAHTGYYSAMMSPKLDTVIAVEPNAKCQAGLAQNLRQLKRSWVHVAFAGDVAGALPFVETDRGFSYAAFDGRETHAASGPTMPVVTIDDLVRQHDVRVRAIKIDVDGPDLLVLKGASEVMLRDRPVALIEAQADAALLALAKELQCDLFASVFVPESRRSAWIHIPEPRPHLRMKMIFVVPSERASAFAALVGI